MSSIRFISMLLLSTSIPLSISVSSQPTSHRGIKPSDIHLYASSTFSCLSGSVSSSAPLPASRINDDYCDCTDGSDEPGTSACPTGSFYCSNRGAQSLRLPSSRVNDGLCDCCDGSDEWQSTATATGCPNTCAELGQQLYANVEAEIAATAAGLQEKTRLLEEARVQQEERKAKLAAFEIKLAERQTRLDAAKVVKDREEQAETQERERMEQLKSAQEALEKAMEAAAEDLARKEAEARGEIYDPNAANEASRTALLPPDGDQGKSQQENQEGQQQQVDLSDDDEIRSASVASPAQAVDAPAATENFPYPAEYQFKPNAEAAASLNAEVEGEAAAPATSFPYPAEYAYDASKQSAGNAAVEAGNEEEDGEDENEEEGEEEDGVDESEDDRKLNQEENKYESEAANAARAEFDAAQKKFDKMSTKINDLRTLLAKDFGPNLEFASFYSQCFSISQKQYTYEMCPFESAKQKEGSNSYGTSLGTWTGFGTRTDERGDATQTFKFERGQSCWQGPQRSLTVLLRCGAKNEILSVEEPSKCVYEMVFATPMACDEQRAEKLQRELQIAKGEQEEGEESAQAPTPAVHAHSEL